MKKIAYFIWRGCRLLIIKSLEKYYQLAFNLQLYLIGVEHGTHTRTYNACPTLQISRFAKKVKFGDHVTFNNYFNTSWYTKCKIVVKPNAEFTIGNYSGMNGCLIYCCNSISIGEHVDIGGGTRIYDTNFHSLNYLERRNTKTDGRNASSKPIIIEDDVFIGTNCIIGKGITIGARSVIAAGSVVVKNVPADEIWGGNPAKFIKKINEDS